MHAIKIKGPWTVSFRADGVRGNDSAEVQTVHLPAEWRGLFGEASGRAIFERRFNRPTGLSEGHRVRIQFCDVGGLPTVRLNDEAVDVIDAGDARCEVEITTRLRPHNLLSVEVQFDPTINAERPGGLWQPVLLVIEEPL